MTREAFSRKYGAEWTAFTQTPMFEALLAAVDEASPIRQSPNEAFINAAGAAAVLYNQCQGWEALRKFLSVTLIEPPPSHPREESYAESQIPTT